MFGTRGLGSTLTRPTGTAHHDRMDIQTFPNLSRPGVGQKPRRESQRPLLPQHSRHCPVLEAGSGLGMLVYAPLEPNESINIEFLGDGKYDFHYLLAGPGGRWQEIFSVLFILPVGSLGMVREEVTFKIPNPPITKEGAVRMAGALISNDDLGTPPGGVTFKGATGFKTPKGWDTVYGPVLNMIERPLAPMLVVRVETDWYPHESEFRYVLQPGEALSANHHLPIGQVHFVPREEIVLRESTEEEVLAVRKAREDFVKGKAATKLMTKYGLQYSPHYARQSRTFNDAK